MSATKLLARATPRLPATAPTALCASGARRGYASHGGSHYNEPSGYLFGEKPPAPGHRRVKEDWENIWMYGMFGTMGLAGVLLYYKPDTSIQTWAMNEAKARMEARGEKVEYKPS
ncbi:hypothetical protein BOTBODRAFT_135697 [Botryobasidium botryosum FD-172 SS1]|uniref:NADH dehydrogenase [ubiquinone] 1 beta subcomplex subunit 11, mitochondrial n=1 Tax=Botryobasidium botryosum (strain FD-172 SS1) TaxID=930990 RepID=A0A067MA91_BOTB1|nr:hypothetical protein BOTBODRAFT_135697 [Botryobasidium botryosum FD-172 SS1]